MDVMTLQEDFFTLIDKAIKDDKLSHAYLIETNDLLDVDSFLFILIKKLLCPTNNYKHACTKCNVCSLIDSQNYADLKIIDTSSAYIKKEQLLDVKDAFISRSVYGGRQIYVIKDASKLNTSSGNTMLKFLEEPSSNIIAILVTKNRYHVLDTILSRCQIISLESDAISSFDENCYKLIETLFVKNNGFLAYDEILSILPDRFVARSYSNMMEKFLFSCVQGNFIKVDSYNISSLFSIGNHKIYKFIFILEEYLQRMEFNVNYKIMLDNFLLDISEVIS